MREIWTDVIRPIWASDSFDAVAMRTASSRE